MRRPEERHIAALATFERGDALVVLRGRFGRSGGDDSVGRAARCKQAGVWRKTVNPRSLLRVCRTRPARRGGMADAMLVRASAATRSASHAGSSRVPRRVASFQFTQLSGVPLRPRNVQPQLATPAGHLRRGARRVSAGRYAPRCCLAHAVLGPWRQRVSDALRRSCAGVVRASANKITGAAAAAKQARVRVHAPRPPGPSRRETQSLTTCSASPPPSSRRRQCRRPRSRSCACSAALVCRRPNLPRWFRRHASALTASAQSAGPLAQRCGAHAARALHATTDAKAALA